MSFLMANDKTDNKIFGTISHIRKNINEAELNDMCKEVESIRSIMMEK